MCRMCRRGASGDGEWIEMLFLEERRLDYGAVSRLVLTSLMIDASVRTFRISRSRTEGLLGGS